MANPLLNGLRRVHPEALLREDVLPSLGRSKTKIARLLGISRTTLHDLLGKRQPVTAAMAVRVGKLTETTPESWLTMQRNHDGGTRVGRGNRADTDPQSRLSRSRGAYRVGRLALTSHGRVAME